jgi:hypothetical protein
MDVKTDYDHNANFAKMFPRQITGYDLLVTDFCNDFRQESATLSL